MNARLKALFLSNPGRPITIPEIHETLWAWTEGPLCYRDTISVQVHKVRKTLPDGYHLRALRLGRGNPGYILTAP